MQMHFMDLPHTVTDYQVLNKVLRVIGLIGAICTTLAGQSHLFGEPYLHYLIIGGLICSTIIAFYMKPPRNVDTRERVTDPVKKDA